MNAKEIEKCIDAFGTDIYRFCLKLCADKADAEDLYQQTFLKALETEWTLDWESNPKACFSLWHIIFGKATEESRRGGVRLLRAVILMTRWKRGCVPRKVLKKIVFKRN